MTAIITHRNFNLADTPDLSGKVAVITGGHAGIGRVITTQLLLHGVSKVYILARSKDKYEKSKAQWTRDHGLQKVDVEARTDFVQCDLTSIKHVARVATELVANLERLDVLINNAAMALTTDATLSPDGIEAVFATNHVGHFTLTNILLPLIERTAATHGEARIVNTSSPLHMICQELNLAELESPTQVKASAALDSVWRYGRSKLANILFTRRLAKILQKKGVDHVYVNSYFPGNIPTDAWEAWKPVIGDVLGALPQGIFHWIGQCPAEGAATAIFLAASNEVVSGDMKGKYFTPIAYEEKPSALAEDKDLANNLWYWSDHRITKVLGEGWAEAGNQTEAVEK
ncbi:putative short chain dehydrogenase/reductase [Delitschia confertaspora ATCC 74209]|uniref:Short chain dehydrogenase/reductase n=1 Tax=Delitschia confertaspora ATCC 74209 TaxID=1513339 RepID=A0A9P4JNP2_9PLEO|nr:putative short chain dehydrogenase/reductase [Delitschia confertaspora ATCC 74209]